MGRRKRTDLILNENGERTVSSVDLIKLSVIIPAYNLENCIGDCLDAILAQEIKNIEIIVVDDCSTDNTWNVIQSYAEKYKQVIPVSTPKNQGPAAARNVALDIATGEYIHFCDGDDLVPKKAYKELLRVAWVEDADIVTGNYSRKYPDAHNIIKPFSHYTAETGIDRCFESGNTMLWNKIYRREIIEKNHLRFDNSLKTYEDYLFYSQFLLTDPSAAYTDMYVYIYTEPSTRSTNGHIRYADLNCASNLNKAWREIFSNTIQKKWDLWRETYQHNLDWYYNWSWKWIQDLETKRQAFEILRDLVCWVEKTVIFCSWVNADGLQKFFQIFHTDYTTFYSISFEDYLIHLALLDNLRPRSPLPIIERDLERLPCLERDEKLSLSVKKQLEELQAVSGQTYENKFAWKKNYWNLIDSIVNDYWRQLQDMKEKEALFDVIRNQINKDCHTNKSLCLSSTDDVWMFKQIFCVDYATLQILNVSQYMAACLPRFSDDAIDPVNSFVKACRDGKIGLRKIVQGTLKAFKNWLKYKLSRRKGR